MFKIHYSDGLSRSGELKMNGSILKTPALFPAMVFYGGASKEKLYGGGIYRYLKENLKEFDCALTSVTNFLDFKYSNERVEQLLQQKVKKIFNFNGMLFIDSGGFKLLTGNTKARDGAKLIGHGGFTLNPDPEIILDMQKKMGADIAATLDFPISPDLNQYKIRKLIDASVENAKYALENKPQNMKIYAAVHGHDPNDITYCLKEIKDGFDGYAIGSLVPIKNNYKKLIDIVLSVKPQIPEGKPLHVFGITGSVIPILAYLGVDSFDSATYIHQARYGNYTLPGLQSTKISKSMKLTCCCPVCKDGDIKKFLNKNNVTASKTASNYALHNYYVYKKEITNIQTAINEENLEAYIVKSYNKKPQLMKAFEYAKNKFKKEKLLQYSKDFP